MGKRNSLAKLGLAEADSASTNPAQLRASSGFPKGPKAPKKPYKRTKTKTVKLKIPKPPAVTSEAAIFRVKTHLRESDGVKQRGSSNSRFRVILIQEGMGNLRDCFYYTKECLQASAPLFDGKKCFADHPNQLEEQIHPERSTKDVLGYYENCEYVEEAGRGQIQADLVLLAGVHFDWARSLLTSALEYVKNHPNEAFVGFSINAQGEAGSAPISDFISDNKIPDECLGKLQDAMSQGIEDVRPVKLLTGDQVSCDLVTEAGAGGKILTMMERNKRPMKVKTNGKKTLSREAKSKARRALEAKHKQEEAADGADAADGGDGGDGQDDHADAAQDMALFQKMIKQYLPSDSGVDSEEAVSHAKHAYEAAMAKGMEEHEAYEEAGKHLQMAHEVGKRMAADGMSQEEEEEAHEAGHDEEEEEAHEAAHEEEEESAEEAATPPPTPAQKKAPQPMPQESKQMIKLKAEVASLRESQRRMETRNYLEKKLAASDRSPEFIKAFREALGKPRSIAHVEEIWGVFKKAADVAEGFEMEESGAFTENSSSRLRESTGGTVLSFKDCLK